MMKEEAIDKMKVLQKKIAELEKLLDLDKSRQKDLIASEIRYTELFNNTTNCIAVYEAKDNGNDFIIKDFNKAAERVEQVKKKDIVGKSVLKIFPGVKDFGLFNVFKRVWKTGKSEQYPVKFYKDNRISGWRENYVLKLPCGEITAIYQDLTDIKIAEEALKDSEVRYRKLFESAKDGILIIDAETKLITDANAALLNMMGYARKELLGKKPCDACFFKDIETCKNIFSEVESKKVVRYEGIPFKTKTGSIIQVDFVSNIYEIDHTKVIQCSIRDVTEHKKTGDLLRESEEKYRTLIEFAQDAIFSADIETGIILDANKKAEELLGVPLKDIIGMHQTELHPKEDAEFYKNKFKRSAQVGKGLITTAYVYNRGGYNIPVQINANVIKVNGRKVLMGIFRDITDLKRIEEALRKEKVDLEKLVGERTIELMTASKELEDSKRLSDIGALAATIAHELRNPLGVIRTAVYNIKNKSKDRALGSHLAVIDKKILESDQIIKNLLLYAKIKMPHYENLLVCHVLNDCIAVVKEKYANAKFDVKLTNNYACREDQIIQADSVQVAELFTNIIDNSYQAFSDKRGEINITAECDEKKNKFNITISDNGAGIDEKDMPNIFNQFFTTKARGIGLGLTVCRQVVNLHNGEIKIDSVKGKGTTVYVSLPLSH